MFLTAIAVISIFGTGAWSFSTRPSPHLDYSDKIMEHVGFMVNHAVM